MRFLRALVGRPQIDLKGATNILGSKWDDVLQSPTLEQLEPANSATPGSALAANGTYCFPSLVVVRSAFRAGCRFPRPEKPRSRNG